MTKVQRIFLFNAILIALDNAIYRLSISLSSPEIMSKVVVKRKKSLDVFALPNFKGAGPPKVVPTLSPPSSSTSGGKVS